MLAPFGMNMQDLAKAGELIKASAEAIKRIDDSTKATEAILFEQLTAVFERLDAAQMQQSSIIERLTDLKLRVQKIERYYTHEDDTHG